MNRQTGVKTLPSLAVGNDCVVPMFQTKVICKNTHYANRRYSCRKRISVTHAYAQPVIQQFFM